MGNKLKKGTGFTVFGSIISLLFIWLMLIFIIEGGTESFSLFFPALIFWIPLGYLPLYIGFRRKRAYKQAYPDIPESGKGLITWGVVITLTYLLLIFRASIYGDNVPYTIGLFLVFWLIFGLWPLVIGVRREKAGQTE